jgi:hypothetical protein
MRSVGAPDPSQEPGLRNPKDPIAPTSKNRKFFRDSPPGGVFVMSGPDFFSVMGKKENRVA